MKAFLACIVFLLLGATARADDYTNGYTEDGYVYNSSDGYWYSGGFPYTREKTYYSSNQYYNGYYYPKTYYYYKYHRYSAPTYVAPALPKYSDANWQTKLLEIAHARDQFEGNLRKSMLEQQNYIQAVQALGLQGNFHWSSYGSYPSVINQYGVTGNTVYGRSFASISETYSPNLDQLYQQSAALAKNAQELGGQATQDFSSLIQQTNGNATRIAEILAKGRAASEALTAANAATSSTITTVQSGSQSGTISPNPGSLTNNQISSSRQKAAQNCTQCHSGATLKGNFNVATFWNLPPETRQALVKKHLLSPPTDPKHMPQGKGYLSPEDLLEFIK